jgi:hypothetical protein
MDNTLKIALWILLGANILAAGAALMPKGSSVQSPPQHHAEKFVMANAKISTSRQEPCLKLWSLGAEAAQSAQLALGPQSKASLFKLGPQSSWWIESQSAPTEAAALSWARQWELAGGGPFGAVSSAGGWRVRSGPYGNEAEGKIAMAKLPMEVKADKGGVMLAKTVDSSRYQIRFGPWPMDEAKSMAAKMRESGNLKIESCDAKEREEWESLK